MSEPKTALLVDDDDELREATRDHLEAMGYAVSAAAGAGDALREAEASAGFDLLVSDVFMPGMNGIELTGRLLAREPALAVLLISSRGGEPEVRRRLAAGDVAFLAKPFSLDELAAAAAEAFERVSRRAGGATSERRTGATFEAAPAVEEPRPGPARSRSGIPAEIQLAGALVLVLGLGVVLRSLELGAPSLPAPAARGPVRSATIEVVAPLGPLDTAPGELAWLPVEGASSYLVSLRTIDGTALWQTEVAASPADVPAEIEAALHRAVTYYWSVEALDSAGRLLARSELAPFVIELADRP